MDPHKTTRNCGVSKNTKPTKSSSLRPTANARPSVPKTSEVRYLDEPVELPKTNKADDKAVKISNANKIGNKPVELLSLNTLVTLIGGKSDNPTKFSIHKEFACRYSPVFNAAFNSGFIEGQTLEYRLDDVGETEIRMLIQWIYTQMICCRSDGDEYLQLVKLWVLADRLCIAPLQNAAFDKLYSIKLPLNDDDIPSIVSFVDSIYSITSSNSKMRQFVVAKCAFYIEPDDIRSVFRAFPYDFVVDYASYLHNRTIINKEIRRQGVSYYHTQ